MVGVVVGAELVDRLSVSILGNIKLASQQARFVG